jgi:hypothetical protein
MTTLSTLSYLGDKAGCDLLSPEHLLSLDAGLYSLPLVLARGGEHKQLCCCLARFIMEPDVSIFYF